jgi:hypothetical protein
MQGVNRLLAALAAAALLVSLASCSSTGRTSSPKPISTGTVPSDAVQVTSATPTSNAPAPTNTSAVAPAYPPKTIAQVKALAQTGNASLLTITNKETKPNGPCQRPNWYAIVDPATTGQALALAELAVFSQESAFTATCPAYLYVFHTASEISAGGYTAGAVILDSGILDVHTGDVTTAPTIEVKQ